MNPVDKLIGVVKEGAAISLKKNGYIIPFIFSLINGNPVISPPLQMDDEEEKEDIGKTLQDHRDAKTPYVMLSEAWYSLPKDSKRQEKAMIQVYDPEKGESIIASTIFDKGHRNLLGEWKTLSHNLKGRFAFNDQTEGTVT